MDNASPRASSGDRWSSMQQSAANEARDRPTRQENLNLSNRLDESMRCRAGRAWRLEGILPDSLTKAQVKPQVIKGLPTKLQASVLAQSQPFDAMVSTIEKIIHAGAQQNSGAHQDPEIESLYR